MMASKIRAAWALISLLGSACLAAATKSVPADENVFAGTMAEMTWQQVKGEAEAGAIVLLPIAVVEEHGPHMDLTADIYLTTIKCRIIQERLRENGIRAIIAPPLNWGMNANVEKFPGSFTVRPETFRALLLDAAACLQQWGFWHVFAVNDHGDPQHNQVLASAMEEIRRSFDLDAHVLEKLKTNASFPQLRSRREGRFRPDYHAGAFETAEVYAFFPDKVNVGLAKMQKPQSDFAPLGYVGDPASFQLELPETMSAFEKFAAYEAGKIAAFLERGKGPSRLCGEYEYYDGQRWAGVKVLLENNRLMLDHQGLEAVALEAADEKRSLYSARLDERAVSLRFAADDAGEIASFTLTRGAIEKFQASRKNNGSESRQLSVAEAQADFRQLQHIVESTHPALHAFIGQRALEEAFAQQFQQISQPLSAFDLYRLLAPLLAKIGCVHTALAMPFSAWIRMPNRFFSLRLRMRQNRPFVAQGEVARGSELLSINGRPLAEIIPTLKASIGSDAHVDTYKSRRLERDFSYAYALQYGFPESFAITYRLPGGRAVESALLKPWDNDAVEKAMAGNPALDLAVMEKKRAAVMTIGSFIYYGEEEREKFTAFIDEAFKKIAQNRVKRLLIDLRGNEGGNPDCASHLWSYLEPKPLPYFDRPYERYRKLAEPIPPARDRYRGRLFFLVDGRCISTCGHFLALCKYHRVGKMIGEETGGTFTCNSHQDVFHLKNSRLELWCPCGSFSVAVKKPVPGRGLVPDYPFEWEIADLVVGRDTVREYALKKLLAAE